MPLTDLEIAFLSQEQARKRLYSILDWLQCDKQVISEETYNHIWQDIRTLIDYHLVKQKEELSWYRKMKTFLLKRLTA
jgi:hypothetical protein